MKSHAVVVAFLAVVVSCATAPEEEPVVRPSVELSMALTHYLKAQDRLAQDDRPGAGRALAQLADVSEGVLKEEASRAAQSQDLEEMRTAFSAVSAAMIEDHEIPPGYTVMHCPMVGKEGAEWIQARGDVRNPYMGSAMLECGSPVEQQ